eukprot:jgi/Tetstr1/440285/TSEL_028635.t1
MASKAGRRIEMMLQELQVTDAEAGSGPTSPMSRVDLSGMEEPSYTLESEASGALDMTDMEMEEGMHASSGPRRRSGMQGRHSGYLLERIENDYRARISELELQATPALTQPHTAAFTPPHPPTRPPLPLLTLPLSEAARDRAAADVAHEQLLSERDHEIRGLRSQLDEELKEVLERQAQVEAAAPAIQGQMRAVRDQLERLHVTEAQYVEILQVPRDRRPLVDEVKVAVYDAQKAMRAELEELRGGAAAAREANARAQQEAAHLRRENARIAASVVDREKDADGQVSAYQARVERLSAELEEMTVRAEVLAAKGSMYDDLQAKCDKLEEENQKLLSTEAALKRAQTDIEEIRKNNREREHTLQMLMMDKAYLSKECEALSERERKLEAELDSKGEKVAALKKARQELYDKLLSGEANEAGRYERRLSDEIARIQAEASSHIDRIRKESTEMFERETRLLRELRDSAQQEAAAAAAGTKALQGQYDDLLLQHRDLQKRADLQRSELQGEIRMNEFERDRLRVQLDEKEAGLKQAVLQVEMLQEKVRVLTESYYNLEAEKHRRAADLESQLLACQERLGQYERMETDIDTAVLRGGDDADLQNMLAGSLPLAVRRRVQQSLQLAARVSRLEAERVELAQAKEAAASRAQSLEGQLASLQAKTRLLGQPQSFLLEQLEDAERKARQADVDLEAAKAKEEGLREQLQQQQAELSQKLRCAEEQCRALANEKSAMRSDLERVLRERGQLDSMRALLAAAVQSAQRGGSASPGRQRSPGRGRGGGRGRGRAMASAIHVPGASR